MNENKKRLTDITILLLRIAASIIFITSGGLKLFGWFGGVPPGGGSAPLMSQAGIGGLLEFTGGILLAIGFVTRPVAFILAGEMAVAYWQFHAPRGLLPIQNQGDSSFLLCFVCLFLAAYGAGKLSVDDYTRKPAAGKRNI